MNSVPDAICSGPREPQPVKSNRIRTIAEFIAVGVCTLAFLLTAGGICASLLARNAAGSRDFVSYWASGHQLVHRANPYDEEAILSLERSAGYPSDTPALFMRNPPWALPVTLLLGFTGPRYGELLWFLLLASSLVISARLVWIMHGTPSNSLHLFACTFGPAMVCLAAGQMAALILLGLALFLRLHQGRPFLAGASLWFCVLKPHLFLPFGLVLLLWAGVTRGHKLLTGLAVAMGATTAVALLFDPLVWIHYRHMLSSDRVGETIVPCVSEALRLAISPHTLWLQFVPAVFGCIWALSFFRTNRNQWDWLKHGSILMLVSLLVAPYAWMTDQALLIPALLHALYLSSSRVLAAALALASVAVQLGLFRGGTNLLHSGLYLWTAPAWLVWYLLATRPPRSPGRHQQNVAVAPSPILTATPAPSEIP